MPRRLAVVVLLFALARSACTRSSDGVPVAAPGAQQSTSTTTVTTGRDEPAPGVVPTPGPSAGPEPLCAPASLPPVRTVALVADPDAPTATVAVPDGWSMSGGNGDVGAELNGPAGMRAVVTIAATDADAETAFREYADQLTADSSITTLSVLPGELCGLSGQTLLGILSDGTQTVQYRDRIVHVPTGGRDYLIAVHVTAPSDAPGFDEPAALLTDDFEIGLP
ncbi:hypothetical protein GR927_03335 [Mycolicibacterium sp. 3033]|nr:hypothetical protein [Mycolicibacterium aurantiacum]